MTREQQIVYIQGQIVCAQAEILGMQAENMQRQHQCESMAYVRDDFQKIIDQYGIHHNAVIRAFHGSNYQY